MLTRCCSDGPGSGRSAQTSYLDYGAPHQRTIAASTLEGNSSEKGWDETRVAELPASDLNLQLKKKPHLNTKQPWPTCSQSLGIICCEDCKYFLESPEFGGAVQLNEDRIFSTVIMFPVILFLSERSPVSLRLSLKQPNTTVTTAERISWYQVIKLIMKASICPAKVWVDFIMLDGCRRQDGARSVDSLHPGSRPINPGFPRVLISLWSRHVKGIKILDSVRVQTHEYCSVYNLHFRWFVFNAADCQ